MHLDSNTGGDILRVSAYGEGFVKVAEHRLERSFIITPDQLHRDLEWSDLASLDWSELEVLHPLDLEILLLGTGAHQEFPSPRLYAELAFHRIGLEVMDTKAACRTFNVLASEGRRVAALILVEST